MEDTWSGAIRTIIRVAQLGLSVTAIALTVGLVEHPQRGNASHYAHWHHYRGIFLSRTHLQRMNISRRASRISDYFTRK